jgi:hypothetical protein
MNIRRQLFAIAGMSCLLALAQPVQADSVTRAQAKRIHDRVAGVPPSADVLDDMEVLIDAGDGIGAARLAMQNPAFYNVTLKNLATPWTNREQTVFAPLNDYTATFIGMVRDEDQIPFSAALSEDILYTVNAPGLPAPSADNNSHYETAETQGVNLMTALQRTTQSAVLGIPANATAGLMTTRASSQAFFIDGTNRAMFRFTLLNHLCHDMEQMQDVTRPPDRIRQDVSRSPGGDSRIFLNNCVSCHNGMDPMAQAFAFYDFDETVNRLVYTPNVVNPKYFINADNFRPGFVTPDDHWENRWRAGPNVRLGWSGGLPGSGTGAKSLGQELASSKAFAACQVEKVFKAVCFRAPKDTDQPAFSTIRNNFMTGGYKLKQVFAETANYCKGN